MVKKINIYGASGHGKVIADIITRLGFEIQFVFDDDSSVKTFLSKEVIHKPSKKQLQSTELVLAVGNNEIRKKLSETLHHNPTPPLIHPSAVIAPSAKIGSGTVVMANAVINADTVIGKHCIINTGAIIEHDCVIEDYAHISPNAALAGGVTVGEGTHIGIGANVIPGIKIGKWATIGAGAVIIKDVPDGATVVGNPGREV